MKTVYNTLLTTLYMAKFKITPTTTVAELKEQFRNEVGCVLRVYQGRSEASDGATLVSLGAKEGELECRTSRTVGKFEEAFQNELNLKVKVYTKDNWVKVLDGITLAVAGQLPNGMTKAKMEEHLSYKRDEADNAEIVDEKAAGDVEGLEEFKGMPVVDITFEQIGWPITDEYKELLDCVGIAVYYEFDKFGDFEASATGWENDSLSEALDWASTWLKDDRAKGAKVFISTNIKFAGKLIEDEYKDRTNEQNNLEVICCGINKYIGNYGTDDTWWRNNPALFRVVWDDHTDYFTISSEGDFDNAWDLTDTMFNKLFEIAEKSE